MQLLAFAIALWCAWYTLKPYRGSYVFVRGIAEQSGVEDEETRLRQMIKDLELDFATGKVAPDEYERMKDVIIREASTILEGSRKGPS